MSIYFIQCGQNGPIKIGYTENGVEERMKQLQTACPYKLRLVWVYTGNDFTEADIHKAFQAERVRGEWFHPSGSLFSFIKTNLSNYYSIQTPNGKDFSFIEVFGEHDSVHVSGSDKTNFSNDSIDLFVDGFEISMAHPGVVVSPNQYEVRVKQ